MQKLDQGNASQPAWLICASVLHIMQKADFLIKYGKKIIVVSQALPHLFQMPLICLVSDLNKTVPSYILFRMSKSKKQPFYA